jgi:hypothetical protein
MTFEQFAGMCAPPAASRTPARRTRSYPEVPDEEFPSFLASCRELLDARSVKPGGAVRPTGLVLGPVTG